MFIYNEKKTTKKNNLKKKKKIKFNVPVQFDSAKQNKTERERDREREIRCGSTEM